MGKERCADDVVCDGVDDGGWMGRKSQLSCLQGRT